MIKAFVFGKFLPFHKGHEAMMRFALTQCDYLSVLICCSDKETIRCDARKSWIEKTFEKENRVEVVSYIYKEDELPNTSVTSEAVSSVWAAIFKELFPHHSLLITSEPYGEFVASFMHIEHMPFDMDKKQFPVSATSIRNDLFVNWNFLPDSVKPFFVIKVVILGTESTGKTTLTKQLAGYFNCSAVTEAGRDIVADSKDFAFEDLHIIAYEHAKRIDKATTGNSALIIIDTDIHITKSYALFAFQQPLPVPETIMAVNKADLYLYLNNDVEYIQDGTRLTEDDRNLLDHSHRKVLNEHNIPIIEIRGNWEQRFATAVEYITNCIKGKPS
jgi:HTH-type transcriptional regulator, transcriptional repressor of NAD biosynthesis genes